MAFTIKWIGEQTGLPRVAYNVDWSVGQIGYNKREDTMLVQALMRIFYYEMMGFNHGMDPPPGQTSTIEVDGWYGPVTQKHITHFQEQLIARGHKVLRDGLFDPFRAAGQSSSISKTRYSLELLNNGCSKVCEEQGEPNYINLPNRTDMPIQLRNALKTVKSTAAQHQR